MTPEEIAKQLDEDLGDALAKGEKAFQGAAQGAAQGVKKHAGPAAKAVGKAAAAGLEKVGEAGVSAASTAGKAAGKAGIKAAKYAGGKALGFIKSKLGGSNEEIERIAADISEDPDVFESYDQPGEGRIACKKCKSPSVKIKGKGIECMDCGHIMENRRGRASTTIHGRCPKCSSKQLHSGKDGTECINCGWGEPPKKQTKNEELDPREPGDRYRGDDVPEELR